MKAEKVIRITKKFLRKFGCSEEEIEKYTGKVVVRRWTFGEKRRAQSESGIIDPITKAVTFDAWEFTIHKFLGCVKEAPFSVTKDEIINLPVCVGELIEDVINDLIGISPKEAQNLGSLLNKEL